MIRENIAFGMPSLFLNVKKLFIEKSSRYRDMHFHNAIELVYVNSGEILCYINDDIIPLSADMVLLINSGAKHKLTYSKPAEITYIQINVDQYLKMLNATSDIPLFSFLKNAHVKSYLTSTKNEELFLLFQSIIKETDEKNIGYDTYIKAYITALIGFMCRNELLYNITAQANIKKLQILMPAVNYIHENFAFSLTLEDIAKQINCNKYKFCKLFKANIGFTAFEYINLVRINNAQKQLIETDKTVSEIAFVCGFSSIQYFNRVFKEQSGCAPKAYKRQYKNIIFFN